MIFAQDFPGPLWLCKITYWFHLSLLLFPIDFLYSLCYHLYLYNDSSCLFFLEYLMSKIIRSKMLFFRFSMRYTASVMPFAMVTSLYIVPAPCWVGLYSLAWGFTIPFWLWRPFSCPFAIHVYPAVIYIS